MTCGPSSLIGGSNAPSLSGFRRLIHCLMLVCLLGAYDSGPVDPLNWFESVDLLDRLFLHNFHYILPASIILQVQVEPSEIIT